MPLDLIVPIASFPVGYVFIMLGVRIIRDANARRRKAELRRARDAHFEQIQKAYRDLR